MVDTSQGTERREVTAWYHRGRRLRRARERFRRVLQAGARYFEIAVDKVLERTAETEIRHNLRRKPAACHGRFPAIPAVQDFAAKELVKPGSGDTAPRHSRTASISRKAVG